MKNFQRYLGHVWQPAMLYFAGLFVVFGLLFFRLGTLVKPYSATEHTARQNSSNIGLIAENPANGPHKLGQYVLQAVGKKGPLAMRSISALFGLLAVWLFFYISRIWFTERMAALGSLLFVTSSWFLHTARAATPDILLMGILALIACGAWLRYSNRRSSSMLVAALAAALCLYVPGLIWFVVIFLLLQTKTIGQELRAIPSPIIMLSIVLWFVLISPLVVAGIRHPDFWYTIAGLPSELPSLNVIGKNIADIPVQLFVRGPDSPGSWLGRLPLLDVFSAAMLVLGLYRLYFQRKLDRTKLLLGSILIGAVLIALDGPVNLTILLPFVYILIMSGFALLLQQWFTVFPRNPLARSLGTILLSASVLLAVFYHVNRYFVAWPNAPVTRQAHSHQP